MSEQIQSWGSKVSTEYDRALNGWIQRHWNLRVGQWGLCLRLWVLGRPGSQMAGRQPRRTCDVNENSEWEHEVLDISRSMYLQVGACKNLQALVSGQREPWIEHRRGRMWGSRRVRISSKGPMSHGFCPGDCIISPRKTPIMNYIDMEVAEVSINGGYPQ